MPIEWPKSFTHGSSSFQIGTLQLLHVAKKGFYRADGGTPTDYGFLKDSISTWKMWSGNDFCHCSTTSLSQHQYEPDVLT